LDFLQKRNFLSPDIPRLPLLYSPMFGPRLKRPADNLVVVLLTITGNLSLQNANGFVLPINDGFCIEEELTVHLELLLKLHRAKRGAFIFTKQEQTN
tara:strand:- start:69 stop:359 length:291 start_codon:yes stop_codon:yes gene_type:complete